MRKIEKIINVYKFDELCDSAFYNDIVAMNGELENFGYSCIDYYNTEDSVLSLLEEAEFLVDGSVYYD